MNALTALIRRAQSGNLDAFDALVRRFQDMAVGYAYTLIGDFHLAEDAAQEAFLDAYRNLPQLREAVAFSSWFRTIVFKHCDRFRRQTRVETIPLEAGAGGVAGGLRPDEALEEEEMRDRILAVVRALPEAERQVITLFYISEYSQHEIAAFLAIPVSTVKNRLRAGRARLKERMIDMAKKALHEEAPSRDDAFADEIGIFTAAQNGDAKRVRQILKARPDLVNAQNWYQFPIHTAVREGHAEIVDLLLKAGADPGQSRFTYNSWDKLLGVAQERGHGSIQALLEATMKQRFNYAPEFQELKTAIIARERERVEALLRTRPELARSSDALGNSALHWAVLTRQIGLIDLFLERGADIHVKRADGCTPVLLSAYNYDYWSRPRDLTDATIRVSPVITGYLLAKGAEYGLSVAAAIGDRERVEQLLREDPGLACRLDSARHSPLHYAARSGYTRIVQVLLDHGADPNMPEDLATHGRALFDAAAGNHLETAKLLLDRGADPNAGVDSSGCCLTIVEVRHPQNCHAMQDLLKSYGAFTPPYAMSAEDMKQALSEGHPAVRDAEFLDSLVDKNDEGLIVLLLQKDPVFPSRMTGGNGYPKSPGLIQMLLGHGLDPNRPDWLGKTFLHACARNGDQEAAAVFLESGADINALDLEYGETPLASAVRSGQQNMVQFLLERGARVDLPDSASWARPLTRAEKQGHAEIADLLRRHGAKG